MWKFIAIIAFLSLLLTACVAVQDLADPNLPKEIAKYLEGFAEVEDCNVKISGGVAVVSINLAGEPGDDEIVALKKRIASDVEGRHPSISRVSVNIAPEIFEDALDTDSPKSRQEAEIDKKLEKNADKEIFNIPAPTL